MLFGYSLPELWNDTVRFFNHAVTEGMDGYYGTHFLRLFEFYLSINITATSFTG